MSVEENDCWQYACRLKLLLTECQKVKMSADKMPVDETGCRLNACRWNCLYTKCLKIKMVVDQMAFCCLANKQIVMTFAFRSSFGATSYRLLAISSSDKKKVFHKAKKI